MFLCIAIEAATSRAYCNFTVYRTLYVEYIRNTCTLYTHSMRIVVIISLAAILHYFFNLLLCVCFFFGYMALAKLFKFLYITTSCLRLGPLDYAQVLFYYWLNNQYRVHGNSWISPFIFQRLVLSFAQPNGYTMLGMVFNYTAYGAQLSERWQQQRKNTQQSKYKNV